MLLFSLEESQAQNAADADADVIKRTKLRMIILVVLSPQLGILMAMAKTMLLLGRILG